MNAYADVLQNVYTSALPVVLLAFVVALFLKAVPLRGLDKQAAPDVGRGFGMPDHRAWDAQLTDQVARLLQQELPDELDAMLVDGVSAERLWVIRLVAGAQRRGDGVADPERLARSRHMPLGIIAPAVRDAIDAGLVEEVGTGVRLTPDGEDALRAVGDHVWTWLLAQLRDSRPDGLSQQDEEQARRIASELTLFDAIPADSPPAVLQSGR